MRLSRWVSPKWSNWGPIGAQTSVRIGVYFGSKKMSDSGQIGERGPKWFWGVLGEEREK